MEAYILQHLKAFGIPEIQHYGYNSTFNILIMELLGQSLENLFQAQNKSFSIKTACMLGIQMIDRIEYVHSRKIIHRDIKPDNFVIGRGLKSHIVYILDFGLSKKYWSVSHKCHLPFIKGKKLTGTARYASVNCKFLVYETKVSNSLGKPAHKSFALVSFFFSHIFLYLSSFLLTFNPCQGRLPLMKYIIIYPILSKSSLLLCSHPLKALIDAYLAVPVNFFPLINGK